MHKKHSLTTTFVATTIGLASLLGCKNIENIEKTKIDIYHDLAAQYGKLSRDIQRLTDLVEHHHIPPQRGLNPAQITYSFSSNNEGQTTCALIRISSGTPDINDVMYTIESFTPHLYCTLREYDPSSNTPLLHHPLFSDIPDALLEQFLPTITITATLNKYDPRQTYTDYALDGICDEIINKYRYARTQFHILDFYIPTEIKTPEETEYHPPWYRRFTTRLDGIGSTEKLQNMGTEEELRNIDTEDLQLEYTELIKKLLEIYDKK